MYATNCFLLLLFCDLLKAFIIVSLICSYLLYSLLQLHQPRLPPPSLIKAFDLLQASNQDNYDFARCFQHGDDGGTRLAKSWIEK